MWNPSTPLRSIVWLFSPNVLRIPVHSNLLDVSNNLTMWYLVGPWEVISRTNSTIWRLSLAFKIPGFYRFCQSSVVPYSFSLRSPGTRALYGLLAWCKHYCSWNLHFSGSTCAKSPVDFHFTVISYLQQLQSPAFVHSFQKITPMIHKIP